MLKTQIALQLYALKSMKHSSLNNKDQQKNLLKQMLQNDAMKRWAKTLGTLINLLFCIM